MADFRYSLTQAPQARTDGSGCVDHQIIAQYDEGEGWLVVPSHNKTFCIPADELAVVLAMSNGAAKVQAYKQVLIDNIDTAPQAVTGWAVAQMQAMIDGNNASAEAGADADEYITVTLGQSYPVPFTI